MSSGALRSEAAPRSWEGARPAWRWLGSVFLSLPRAFRKILGELQPGLRLLGRIMEAQCEKGLKPLTGKLRAAGQRMMTGQWLKDSPATWGCF
jgi:hypothetical protein